MTGPRTPRVSTSAICTFELSLTEQLDFWARHAIERVGVSVAKLEAHGWDDGLVLVERAVAASGLTVGNLIGLGPFHLDRPQQWADQRQRLLRSIDASARLGASTLVFTTGPAGALSWEEAADALEAALAPVLPMARDHGVQFAIEHTNSLRTDVGFVHTLRDALDLADRLDTAVCMEVNACWPERGLYGTIRDRCGRIGLVQLSDFAIGTRSTPDRLVPGDGDIPLGRIVGALLDAGYRGDFDIEIIGPRIDAEGYDSAVPRAIEATQRLVNSRGR
jgi:sugar phosphate isomerase/epimerase